MARYVDAIDLPIPPTEAFDYLADFSQVAEWDPGVASAERLSSGEIGLGSRFAVTVSFLGRQAPLTYRITAYERPNRLVLIGGDESIRSIDEITFAPRGDGTRVTYEARLELVGIRKLADPILDVLFQRIGRVAVRGLREKVAARTPRASSARPSKLRESIASVLAVALLSVGVAGSARAAEIEGVRFAERVDVGAEELRLHGTALMRWKIFFKGFVAALYLDEPDDVGAGEVLADAPRRLEIEYFWSISAGIFEWVTNEGMEQSVAPETLATLRERLDRLNALYRDVEPGDRYALTYIPGMGTELALNGEPLGVIEGADFSAALFAMWLGDRPLDDALREQLLAGHELQSAFLDTSALSASNASSPSNERP